MRKQLAYMLGRQYVGLELNDEPKDKADLTNIMSNSHINEHFNSLAREVSLFFYEMFTYHQIYFMDYITIFFCCFIVVGYSRTQDTR